MFNALASVHTLFLISIFSFFTLFTVRKLFIKRTIFVILYHTFFFCVLSVAVIGGGGVQNDGYERLEKLILLEKNNQLEDAKNNPKHYDPMLIIDLNRFKSSDKFRDYLNTYDVSVDRAEAISIGWIFSLLTEVSGLLQQIILFIWILLAKKITQ